MLALTKKLRSVVLHHLFSPFLRTLADSMYLQFPIFCFNSSLLLLPNSTMEAKSSEAKQALREKPFKESMTEEDMDYETEEEDSGSGHGNGNGAESGFLENEKKKKGGAGFSGRRGYSVGCQAQNCGTDLSEGKRYHRRHKVCEVHSKAPVVIVAGLRQRFCQQCSRFHELSEFDDTKRSCRRRLAGHNERRRKNSAEYHGEGSSRRGPGTQSKEGQLRQTDDQRGRIPSGNSSHKHLHIR